MRVYEALMIAGVAVNILISGLKLTLDIVIATKKK
jgi:hypothetical protein